MVPMVCDKSEARRRRGVAARCRGWGRLARLGRVRVLVLGERNGGRY
jgi:hypothetical protein